MLKRGSPVATTTRDPRREREKCPRSAIGRAPKITAAHLTRPRIRVPAFDTLDTTPLPWRRLDADTRRLLVDGDESGRYRSGSELAMSLALRLRNHGRSLDEYIDAMTDSSNAASAWYRELRDGRPAGNGKRRKSARGRARAVAELERCWRKAGQRPAPRTLDPADVYERCQAARARARAILPARTRPTRLAVLDAVLDLAQRHRTVRVLAAERDVALAAGVARMTAHCALHDLTVLGVLGRASGRRCEAAVFLVERCSEVRPDTPHLYTA